MVFESLVVDLLNRFLGDYVENLDRSQLKLGIWGGDAVLENLDVKENALDDLDVPIKIKSGHLGKLTLKIPWKNLYKDAVVATLEGLYVVAVTSSGMKYDAEKERKMKQESKKKELERIEEAQIKEAEKNKNQDNKQDTFAEKLATQIVRNLQIKIRDIHIRYEDTVTFPGKPFSVGVTLQNLSFQTTDQNWKPCILKDSDIIIYKLVSLDALAVYWNVNSPSFANKDKKDLLSTMRKTIASTQAQPKGFEYVLRPIVLTSQLKINPKPETNLSMPKVFVNVTLKEIGLVVGKKQYQGVMEVLESLEQMRLKAIYRKYHPNVRLKGNAKKWWGFAQTAVLEETVRRRAQMWSWRHIHSHREKCQMYKRLYKQRLVQKKASADLLNQLEALEDDLDIFNITVNRQQAEMQLKVNRLMPEHHNLASKLPFKVIRSGAVIKAKKSAFQEEKEKKGFFSSGPSSWFSKKTEKQEIKEPGDLMSAEEKAKLYSAIGYSENPTEITTFPPEYVENKLIFTLGKVTLEIQDKTRREPQILVVSLTDMYTCVQQRPSAQAVMLSPIKERKVPQHVVLQTAAHKAREIVAKSYWVEAKMDQMSVYGMPQNGQIPEMVASQNILADQHYALLSLHIETNPLDGKADTRVEVNAQPLQMVYDAQTVNSIVDFFRPPENVHLQDLTSVAMSKLEEFREQTATGLQHMISVRKVTDVHVDLKSSYIILPQNGFYTEGQSNVVVVDLGSFRVDSVKDTLPAPLAKAKDLFTRVIKNRLSRRKPPQPARLLGTVEEVMSRAYDKFDIRVQSVQVILAAKGEDWRTARQEANTKLHVVQPMGLDVLLQKCMVDNDVRMPNIKVSGHLPLIQLNMSDKKLQEILSLVQSIPLPPPPAAPQQTAPELQVPVRLAVDDSSSTNVFKVVSSMAVGKVAESESEESIYLSAEEDFHTSDSSGGQTPVGLGRLPSQKSFEEGQQKTELELHFEIKEVIINISRLQNNVDMQLLRLAVQSVGAEVRKRTWDLSAHAFLGGIGLQHMLFKGMDGGPLSMISTPATGGTSAQLLSVQYTKVEKSSPDYATVYNSTEQLLKVNFSTLKVVLHRDALVNLLDFVDSLKPSVEDSQLSLGPEKEEEKGDREKSTSEAIFAAFAAKGKWKKKKEQTDEIDIQIDARLDTLSVVVCTDEATLADVQIKGLDAGVVVQKHMTTVNTHLKDIVVQDPTRNSLYPKILSIVGKEVFALNIVVYNDATKGQGYRDMSVVDTSVGLQVGCIRVVFLNKFVEGLVAFGNEFQAAKAALSEAGAQATQAALESAKDFSKTSTRLALDISVNAPVIVIPQSSTNRQALLADLGKLTVQNSFRISGDASKDVPAVLDSMKIDLTALKMSRGLMEKDECKAEILLIEPVNLRLSITRNLAAGWYHDVPEVDISGKLETINVRLGQDDFTMMMATLDQNLNEGKPAAVQPESPPEGAMELKVPGEQSDTSKAEAPRVAFAEVWTKLQFKFELESLSAALHTGKTDLSCASGVCVRDQKTCLGSFLLHTIQVEGRMQSDNSMETRVALVDMTLDDTRPGREHGITSVEDEFHDVKSHFPYFRMFQRASQGSNSMVSVDFVQDNKLNKKIDVCVEQIYLCVCLEYILSVADFFQKGLPQTGTKTLPAQSKPDIDELTAETLFEEIAAGSLAEVSTKPDAPESDLELNLKMGRPEIILIADSKTKDQPALVLDTVLISQPPGTTTVADMEETEVHFQMKITPEFQMMAGSVKDLQIVSCPFEKSKRKGKNMNILHPCFVSLHSKTPQGQGMHIDITTSDLELTISPPIIRTITAITASLTPQQADENGKKTSAVPVDLWCIKSLKECNFWFLQPAAIADVAAVPALEMIDMPSTGEQLLMKVPSLLVKLEASVGSRTVPMLVLEASFYSEVKDWSGKLHVTAELNMEVAYYNDSLTVWEPLLEPVEDGGKRRPWELSAEVTKNVEDDASPLTSPQGEADLEVIPSAPPTMSINVKSSDVMNIVFSKALLTLLTNMGKAFSEAVYDTSPKVSEEEMHSPFMVKNEMGCNVTIHPGPTLQLVASAMQPAGNRLADSQTLYMEARRGVDSGMKKSFLAKQDNIIRHTVSVQVQGYDELKDIPIYKAGRRLYNVSLTENKAVMSIVCQINASDGSKTITFRSPLQVYNDFPVAMELLYRDDSNQLVSLGTIQPRSEFSVPLTVAYRSEIYCRPMGMGYQVSSTSIPWREGLTSHQKIRSTLQCLPDNPGNPTFYTSVEAVKDDLSWVEGTAVSAPCFVLHLRPTAVLHNRLPYPLYYLMQGEKGAAEEAGLGPGLHCPLYTYSTTETVMEIQVKNYLGKEWVGKLNISNNMQELSVCTFEGYEGQQKYTLDLGMLASQTEGFLDLSVFCPYWMVNKTGLTLQYKFAAEEASDDTAVMSHPPNQQDVVLFSFKPKSLFAKKKALLRVDSQSEWSDKFSVDTVGSSGSITCKAAKGTDINYEIGVKIQLSNFSLTKQVIFTPHYLLVNHAEFDISVQEEEGQEWLDVPAGKCTPFWPKPKSQKLRAKLTASPPGQDTTENFQFNQDNNGILLKLVNEVGGIFVDIQVSESANIISFSGYSPGAAAVLIVNHTANNLIHYAQSQQKKEQTYVLAPQQAVLYTWADPTGKKELLWNIDGNEKHNGKDKLIKDGIGEVKLSGDQKLYWVSFLDGLQRVLLFTEDLAVTTRAHEADLERVEQEINLHIHGLGISLVNNETKTEISYIGITSSGVIWEEKLRRRWKPLSLKKCNLLEEAYRKNQILLSMGREPITGPQQLDSGFQVDVSEMRMYKPNKRNVRRMFEPGIWAQVKMSCHQQALHFKVNRLQIDNQLPACVFPCVLYPIAPPKSVALDSAPKPFTELSLVMRQEEHSHVRQIKYFKALMQEYAVSVDQGFLSAIIQLFTTDQKHNPDQELEYFQEDIKVSQTSLMAMMVEGAIGEQKNFYDDLHLGPIKVHLSFSLHGGGDDKAEKTDEEEKKKAPAPGIHFKALNLLLQSVGVTLTEIQDVVFKLAFFERRNAFYSQSQLTGVIVKHYSSQAIKQMYVLVLGLDVLGNPFGLIRGLTEGVGDLFYEPYQGAIQGPEEFAEGLALGVRSLVGHAIGGTAGAVSRITGTVGKGLAALTMDDDYQQKRLQQMSKQPQSVQEGLARGGKGLLMGFVEGVTGVVTKPVEGAKKEGVGGFFKGMGKGLVGVVARPTGGVIDFASSTFNTVKRAAEVGEEVQRLRPPRLIYEDGIIRPYAMREASGNQVLQDVAKGKYAATDTYHFHAVLSTDAKEVFLITNQRVVYCSKGDIFGHWDSDWAYRFDEFREPPSLVEKGIKILAKEGRQLVKKPAFLKSPTAGKIINFTDKKFAQRPPGEPDARHVLGKLKEAMDKFSAPK
ncbi:vacuolar protein sorting-associated protein 13C-like isoform X6 [Branchiostoma floridae]|uniref:Vacuolar protein sorting-associated protein 13C-like isoform X6 n=1 Tax=Branchiostoma floridae TaxID=7739 RepID=A0A9J7KW61_BRAFL|nr:vacuolar protein sorting-associated protein 13C-like isoform X6 [Branchiostoma floridae]